MLPEEKSISREKHGRTEKKKMKKFLSLILALTMIVTCFAVFTITTSAAQGDWEVYGDVGDHDEDTPELGKGSIPGKTYTDNGLELDVPEGLWQDFTPWAKFETREAVDLKQGFYLKVRVDDFSYDAGDLWHAFSIRKYPHLEDMAAVAEDLGMTAAYNPGFQASIRLNSDHTIRPGWNVPYNKDEATAQIVQFTTAPDGDWDNDVDENGCPTYTFQITYDETAGYSAFINGNLLSQNVMDALRPAIDGNNGLMYVSFLAQNNKKGGVVDFTILEYGTSPDDCDKPQGDDNTEPVQRYLSFECEDADSVEAGAPAITLKGKEEGVFAWISTNGNSIYNDDDSVTATFPDASSVWVFGSVDFETNYDIKDFPVAIVITKNLCTCQYEDRDWDMDIDADDAFCECAEAAGVEVMAGDVMAVGGKQVAATLGVTDGGVFKDADGNSYNYFIIDHSEIVLNDGFTGRIHGFRFDVKNLKVNDPNVSGRNTFTVMEADYFRSVDEADAYFKAMMATLGATQEVDDPVDPPVESGDETTDGGDVEPPVNETTDGGDVEPPVETNDQQTNKPTTPTETDPPKAEMGGCGSVVGVGAIAVVALAAAGLVSFKKKED